MMLQQNKIFVYVQLYYGPSMIFLHMQIFLVGVLKGNLLVLFIIRIVCHIDYKTDGNGVTWVIVDFYRSILDFDMIKGHLMEMKCDAPKPEGPLTTCQPAENLFVSYHETHT